MPAAAELSDREVDVWFVRTSQVQEPAALERLANLLSEDERERWQRFTFAEGRHEYLVSHGFLRLVLSRYADVPPRVWRFTRSAYGKPELLTPPGGAAPGSLCFNLTHTNGLAACAVVRDREIGVDAEDVERRGRAVSEDLIQHCLSPAEKQCFESLRPEQQKGAFFDYWTLKEAYLKARGFGLSLPVEAIAFHWPSGTPHQGDVLVEFGAEIGDNPRTWQFERFQPTPQHRIALAVRRLGSPALEVRCREWIVEQS